jgi:two-component system response regulator LytT
MIKVLIVEDEELAALRMQKMLLEIDSSIQVLQIADSVSSAVDWLKTNPNPDLMFLDIQLSDGISFEIFNQIEIYCPVVFVTAYDAYALKAFEVYSIDYLLKPLRKELLEKSLEKFKTINQSFSADDMMVRVQQIIDNYQTGNKTYKSRFAVTKGNAIISIKSDDIAYFYIEDKVLFLSTHENQRHIINYTLEQLEETLNPLHFFRVNRQYIVSINSIEKVHYYFNYKLKLQLKPESPHEVIVSTSKTKDFKNWLDSNN